MASSQNNRSVAQLNADQKAKVDKAIDDAKKFLGSNQSANDASQYQLAKVSGSIANYQQRPVTIMNTHNYQGKFAVKPPAVISAAGADFFLHEGATSNGDLAGSKAAIVYADPVCGWLVSWYRPDNADEPSKVYAEVGPQAEYVTIDWSAIEAKLDASVQPTSEYKDAQTGAQITVSIQDIAAKKAVLAAVFEVTGST